MIKHSKTIAKVLLFLFIFVSATYLVLPVHAASIWEKRKKALEDIKTRPEAQVETEEIAEVEEMEEFTAALDPEDIYIPDQYGTIIETHKGTNGKLIVHIQSAHVNYEGQINAASILETLIEDYGLNLILAEGKVTNKDLKYLRDRAPIEVRKKVADGLVKDGYFTAVNYLDLSSDYPIVIQGIEDKTLYDAGSEMLWKIDEFKEAASGYVEKMIIASDAIKPQIYSKDLIDLDTKKKDYDSEAIDLLEYYEYLYNTAKEKEIPLYTFPNFGNLIKASDLEKKIDLVKVRDGSASDEEMTLYGEYLDATRDLNINELFKEEPLLEDVLQDTLAVNRNQKQLIKVSKALAIIKNLLKIKVVPEEYKYFTDNKKDFSPQFWADFLKEKSKELNLNLSIPVNSYVISDNLKTVEEFYNNAFERDKIFVEKTDKHIQGEGLDLAALVAGGFHTPSVTRLLVDAGYSFIVVSPKVTTETDEELYRWALKRHWLPEIQ